MKVGFKGVKIINVCFRDNYIFKAMTESACLEAQLFCGAVQLDYIKQQQKKRTLLSEKTVNKQTRFLPVNQ